MVLDDAELCRRVEEAFGLALPEFPLDGVARVVAERLEAAEEDALRQRARCLVLAEELRGRLGRRLAWRPGLDLRSAIPWRDRRPVWKALGERFGTGLPKLRRPREFFVLGTWVCGTGGFLAGFNELMLPEATVMPAIGWGLVITAICSAGWFAATAPMARDLPKGVESLGDLARILPDETVPDVGSPTAAEIAARIEEIRAGGAPAD